MNPNSNFVSARISPTASARRAPSRYSAIERSSSCRSEIGADHVGQLLAADVLVVPDLRLGRRREDRPRQAIGLAQPVGEAMAAHGSGALVLRPSGAGQVAAHHALGVDPLRAPDEHRARRQLSRASRRRQPLAIGAHEVGSAEIGQLLEPPGGETSEDGALVRDRLLEDDVEGREAVGGDEQQMPVVNLVRLAHLAAVDQGQSLDLGAHHGVRHVSRPPGVHHRLVRARGWAEC